MYLKNIILIFRINVILLKGCTEVTRKFTGTKVEVAGRYEWAIVTCGNIQC